MNRHAACLALCTALVSGPSFAFSMYEHKEIGDRAFATALQRLGALNKDAERTLSAARHLRFAPGVVAASELKVAALANGRAFAWFSFGDLVALYGDWAADYGELNSPAARKRVKNWNQMLADSADLASSAENARMMELAAVNTTHFAGTALETYLKWHRLALELAAKPGRLSEALHYEALALHSYTDLFAVGHMLEERALTQALLTWAKTKGSWFLKPLKAVASSVMSKVWGLWANFYHNAFNTRGAQVRNLDGDSWRAYGDDMYRVPAETCAEKGYIARRKCADPSTEKQRAVIDAGVARSVLAVLKTALGHKLARGEAMLALRTLPIHYAETRRPKVPSDQKLRLLRLLNKLGKKFLKVGFDFTRGILQYESKDIAGSVRYADKVKAAAK